MAECHHDPFDSADPLLEKLTSTEAFGLWSVELPHAKG
jgi:hypothetical protein